MLYYLIAGEASGDLHGSHLMKEIAKNDPHARFRFWGGDKMAQVGGTPVRHISELAFMGFKDVLLNIVKILKNLSFCKKDIILHKPEVLILIDYPGFNMRMAKFAKNNGIKVAYYIAPQVWAWKQYRVKALKRDVDKLLVILPFEKGFLEDFEINAEFVGHPLLDSLAAHDSNAKPEGNTPTPGDMPIVALLPGSRVQEINASLPVMVKVSNHFTDFKFVVAGIGNIDKQLYEAHLRNSKVQLVFDQTIQLLSHSTAALVTSGTATLETALVGVPQAVCYRCGAISYFIAKNMVKTKYISLVNLVAGKQVVRELIQNNFNEETLALELDKLLNNQEYRRNMIEEYNNVKDLLGGPGASQKAAREMVAMGKHKK